MLRRLRGARRGWLRRILGGFRPILLAMLEMYCRCYMGLGRFAPGARDLHAADRGESRINMHRVHSTWTGGSASSPCKPASEIQNHGLRHPVLMRGPVGALLIRSPTNMSWSRDTGDSASHHSFSSFAPTSREQVHPAYMILHGNDSIPSARRPSWCTRTKSEVLCSDVLERPHPILRRGNGGVRRLLF